jgi:SAM-dependent methyltransferase
LEYKYLDVCHSKIKFSWDVEFRNQAQIWIDNLMSEVEYWIIENAEETGYYHDDHLTRLQNKQFALLDRNVEYIEKRLTGNETIMDIGSGLLSKYGNYLGEKKIDFIAVDPLAYFYNIINERYHGEKLPKEKKVLFGMFEFIADFYDVDYVDYIIINNALDHCIDPFKSIIECLYVLKSGGVLHLNHTRCEAVFERYLGLHKWNLDYMNNEFIIWNKDNAINVTKELKNIADVEIIISPNETGKRFYDQFITRIVKKRDFELSKFIDEDSERKDLAYVANLLMKQYASSKLCADDDLCKKLNW